MLFPRGDRRCAAVLATLAASALALVACGDSDDGGGSGDQGPVKVGVLTSLTGTQALPGKEMEAGIRLWVKQHPEVAGRKIELVVQDDATDPKTGVTKAQELVTRDEVDMVVGIPNSAVLAAVGDQIAARVPLIVANAGNNEFLEGDVENRFRVSHSNAQNNRPLGWYAYEKLGHRRVAALTLDYAAGDQHFEGFRDVFTRLGGEIVSHQKPPLGAADFGPYISRIPKDVDAVYTFVAGADAVKFWQQAKSFGLTERVDVIGAGFSADDVVLSAVGKDADGFVGALQYVQTIDTPENRSFVEEITAAGGKPNVYSEGGYAVMEAIGAALEASEGELGDAFVSALGEVELSAPRGPISFDDKHQAVFPVYIYKVENGKPKIVETVEGVTHDWSPPSS